MANPNYTAAKPGEFFCPRGGTWYACETGSKFVGCCTADPCEHSCFGGSLKPAGRSSSLNNLSPGGSCGGTTPMWTCAAAPTFWGCCNEDPCMNNSTCPPGKLEPAFWDRPDQYYYFHDLNIALSSNVPEPTAFPTPSNMPSNRPTATAGASPSSVSGAVIGGAVGGSLAFLIIVAAVVFCLCRRRRNRKKKDTETESESTSVIPKAELASPSGSTGFSPPPTYSWDRSGHDSQQRWAHYQNGPQEMLGDTSRSELITKSDDGLGDTCRSELITKPANGPAELHGGLAAGELECSKTSAVAQDKFAHDKSEK